MTTQHGALKPWSMPDDEADAFSPPADVNNAAPGDTAAASASRITKRPRPRIPESWTRPIWASIPLGMSILWTIGAALGAEPGGVRPAHLAVILVLNVAAGGWWWLSRRLRRSTFAGPRSLEPSPTIADGGRPDEGLQDADLREVWRSVEEHSGNADQRIAELVEEQRRLTLALSLAGTQRRQSAAILDSIADPVLVTDSFDQLVAANPSAEELFGFDRASALRRPIGELLNDEKIAWAIRQAREAESRAAKRKLEHAIRGRAYAMILSPVLSENGGGEGGPGHHGVVVVLRDVTKDRESARMKSEFVAQVAHELRTPLSSIRAYVEMLVDGEADDEKTRREYYDIIQTSAHRLGRLIDNILNISRIEAGTVRVNKEPVPISMIVKEAADTLRPQAESKRIELTQELTPVVDRVRGDRDLLHQAVLNLLSNAIKYTPEGGKVAVRMTSLPEKHAVRIEVSDTGVGVPAEDLPRMFEKFFRVEANKKLAGGTGLGLNLVKQIVETIHGGEISLASEVGRGSTFAMTLPLVRP